jgi:putative transposase
LIARETGSIATREGVFDAETDDIVSSVDDYVDAARRIGRRTEDDASGESQARRRPVPWKVESVMDARRAFINDWLQKRHGFTFEAICETHGISRQVGYKWVTRFLDGGLANLVDRSRAPVRRPQTTPEETVDAIVALRKRFPHFGPRKIRVTLEGLHPEVHWPAASTIGDLLKARGLVAERKRRRRTPASTQPFAAATAPNIVWSADYKGAFKVGGRWTHPLTITDNASRFLLCVHGVDTESDELAWPLFERTFREYGLPWRIRTDNGSPFATRGLAGLSQLSVRWTRLGVIHERIDPGKPQQNGRHERMHRTLKAQVARPPKLTATDQQRAFDEFRRHYNTERPHEAIDQKTPTSVYQASSRSMPQELPEPDYPDDFSVRRLTKNGELRWNSESIYLATVLRREAIGVEPIEDGLHHLWFGHVYLGQLREKRKGANEFIANRG